MFRMEGWHPSAPLRQHAQALAATANGPMTRKHAPDTMWTASDFVPDPEQAWAALLQPPPREPTAAEVAALVHAHVEQMNARFSAP